MEHASRAGENIDEGLWPSMVCILNRGIINFQPKERRFAFSHAGLLVPTSDGPQEAVARDPGALFLDVDGVRYPTMLFAGQNVVVDPARVYTVFLNHILAMVQSKAIPERTNVLAHYIPERYRVVLQAFRSL